MHSWTSLVIGDSNRTERDHLFNFSFLLKPTDYLATLLTRFGLSSPVNLLMELALTRVIWSRPDCGESILENGSTCRQRISVHVHR